MKKFVFVLLFVFLLFSGCLIQPQVTIKSLEQKGEKALVELRANKEFNAEVKITDEEGETLCSDKIELKQGNNLIEINCNLTEKKVYVEILSDGAVFSRYFDLTLADDIISDVLDTDLIIDPLRDNITEIINVDYIVKEIIPIEKIPVGLRPVKPIEVEIHPKENVSGCNWYPNPNSYPEYYDESNKIHTATVLHRTTKECGTDKVVKSEEVIKLTDSKGNKLYCNYLCRNRYKEQCILDGSFDKYYDEWCEYETSSSGGSGGGSGVPIKVKPTGCLWYPNPSSYPEYYDESNEIHKATLLHRVTKDCETDEVVKSEETIPLKAEDGSRLYCNYICRNRYHEQCILDGSFDKYYDEWCEYEDAFEPSDSAEEPMLPEEESTQ